MECTSCELFSFVCQATTSNAFLSLEFDKCQAATFTVFPSLEFDEQSCSGSLLLLILVSISAVLTSNQPINEIKKLFVSKIVALNSRSHLKCHLRRFDKQIGDRTIRRLNPLNSHWIGLNLRGKSVCQPKLRHQYWLEHPRHTGGYTVHVPVTIQFVFEPFA